MLPWIAKKADEICWMRSLHTEAINHEPAIAAMQTGNQITGRPCLGSWASYGLGSENQNLPGFITISPPAELGGAQNYGNAFLPAAFQATRIGESGTRVAQARVGNLTSPLSGTQQRRQLDLLQSMNQNLLARQQVNPELEGVINSFELGFRMQNSLPELMDLSGETAATRSLYGLDSTNEPTRIYGTQCLLARRLLERGVRFVELTCPRCRGDRWDQHSGLREGHQDNARAVDQPIAGLLTDLKARGLLADQAKTPAPARTTPAAS